MAAHLHLFTLCMHYSAINMRFGLNAFFTGTDLNVGAIYQEIDMVTFREKVLYKCIKQELFHEQCCDNPQLLQKLMESSGIKFKNVCVRMNVYDKARLEAVSDMLDMSLQEFVLDAINEALSIASDVFSERGQLATYDSMLSEKLESEHIRLVPDTEDPERFRLEMFEEEEK